MAKTYDEKLDDIQKKIKQWEHQKKQLLQKQKEEKHKLRTRRLIERGALLESMMGVTEDFTNEQIKETLAIALNSDEARKALFALRQTIATAGTEKVSPKAEA